MRKNEKSVSDCWERVVISAECMATGAGSTQDRLENAMISGIGALDMRDFPPDLRVQFATITEGTTANTSYEATARVMSDETARHVADTLWSLAVAVIGRMAVEESLEPE